ncbi:uncharacterized protein VP01_14701g1, partial [Puccinia sorghi]
QLGCYSVTYHPVTETQHSHCQEQIPTPLTIDLVNSLLNADTFTKLELQNAYGNLWVAKGNEDKLVFICRVVLHAGHLPWPHWQGHCLS